MSYRSQNDIPADPEQPYRRMIRAFEEIAVLSMEDSMELDAALQLVGRRLLELLDSSRSTVYLRRADGMFACHAGWSTDGDMGDAVVRLVTGHDRLTQQVVSTAMPVLVTDALHDPRPDNHAMSMFGVRDILAVPMVLDGAVIGVIYVDNEGEKNDYTADDLAVAQAFASLAAIVVHQTALRRELARKHAVIEHKNRELEKIRGAAARLSDAMLKGAEIPHLMAMVQQLLHRPVLLYSAAGNLLDWSAPASLKLSKPPILPNAAWKLPEIRKLGLSDSPGSVMVPPLPAAGSHHRRLICPLVVERKRVGFIEAVEFGRPFVSLEREILGQAAIAIALQLLIETRRTDDDEQARSDFVSALLNPYRGVGAFGRRAATHGVKADDFHRLLRVSYLDSDEGKIGKARRLPVERLLREALPDTLGVLGAGEPSADIFLLDSIDEELDLVDHLSQLQRVLQREAGARYILLSPRIHGLSLLPTHAQEMRDMEIALAEFGSTPRLILMEEMRVLTVMCAEGGVARANEFSAGVLAPLLEVDSEGTLLNTVRVFLEVNFHIREAGRRLGLHENTVRYRMDRVRLVTGLDVSSIRDASQLGLALQIYDLSLDMVSR